MNSDNYNISTKWGGGSLDDLILNIRKSIELHLMVFDVAYITISNMPPEDKK